MRSNVYTKVGLVKHYEAVDGMEQQQESEMMDADVNANLLI